jgi:DNA replication factor GINS
MQGRGEVGGLNLYNQIYETWQKEKENIEIQPLSKGFYADLVGYMRKLREERRMLDEKTVRGKLLLQEEENVKHMTEELVQTRYEKMLRAVSKGEVLPTTTLAKEEESLYRDASVHADSFQSFVKNLMLGRLPQETKTNPPGLMVVRILQEIPEIIGADMKTYGPFKPEDIASLPKENAKTLIKQGAATEVETH